MLPTLQFYKFGKLLSQQHSATTYASGVTKVAFCIFMTALQALIDNGHTYTIIACY